MVVDLLLLLAGVVLLYLGGEALVKGAIDMSRLFGLSPMVIGLTVVAFATSAPELAATLTASVRNVPEVAVGNILGSNVANIGLILGLTAMLRPVVARKVLVRRELPVMVAASLILWPLLRDDLLGRWEGLLLVVLLGVFVAYFVRRDKAPTQLPEEVAEELEHPARPLWQAALFVAAGIGLLVGGAWLLVEGAVAIAGALGVPERVIGLTMVALGTSLPELASSLVAARHGHGDIVLGNVIGSNVFNVLCILGVTALVIPIPVSEGLGTDYWVMIGFSLAPLPLLWPNLELGRWEGAVLMAAYVVYVGWLFS